MNNPSLNSEPNSHPGMRPLSGKITFPCVFGRYLLEGEIGAGGMGRVFRAKHQSLKQTVALKTIRHDKFQPNDEIAVRRFYREIEAAGAIIHPNIARATDAGEEHGLHFLVTEYIDGIDLQKLVRCAGPLSPGVACELMFQACQGLDAIHKQKMVHRDIKPSNLLVSWSGQVKVVDLGLARLTENTSASDQLTGSHTLLGTVDFLAPEQAMNASDCDIRADLYSLGCTLFYLTCGQAVFAAPGYSSAAQKLHGHCHVEPDWSPIEKSAPELLPVLKKLLAKNANDRFQTPGDAAEALAEFRKSEELLPILEDSARETFLGVAVPGHTDTASYKYDTTRPAPPSGRTPITGSSIRWMLFGGLSLTVISIAFMIGRSNKADEKVAPPPVVEPVTLDLDSLPTNKWQPLLIQEPVEIIWHSGSAATKWKYDSDAEQLYANCEELGLLEFGKTSKENYKFQVGILQNRWKGGIGVYLGRRVVMEQGQKAIRYQVIHLDEVNIRGMTRMSARRSLEIRPVTPNENFRGITKTIQSEYVDVGTGERTLELVVKDGHLTQIRFGGMELPALLAVPEELKPVDDLTGGFGAWINFSDSTFQNARLMLLDEQPF